MDLIYNRKVFRQFRDSIYYVSKDGEVYSTYKKTSYEKSSID